MKQLIKWHEDGLKNWKGSIEREKIKIRQSQEWVDRETARVLFYEQQIAEAKKRNMKEFDNDKLLIKRKKVQS